MEKEWGVFWLTRSKVIPLTGEREIVADNSMLLTYPCHLE